MCLLCDNQCYQWHHIKIQNAQNKTQIQCNSQLYQWHVVKILSTNQDMYSNNIGSLLRPS